MNKITLTLPEHWACYLYYGETEGLDEGEDEMIDRLLADNKAGDALSSTAYGEFCHTHDATAYGVLPCTCLTYDFPLKEPK